MAHVGALTVPDSRPILSTNSQQPCVGKGNHMGQIEQWQILAEEAAQEQDPKKLLEIIGALTRALDERKQGNGNSNSNERGAA